jgi:ATP-binding cassette, subfamily B, bacterial
MTRGVGATRSGDRASRRDAHGSPRGAPRAPRERREPRAPLLRPSGGWAMVAIAAAVVGAGLRVALVPLFITPLVDRVLVEGGLGELPAVLWVGAWLTVTGSVLLFLQDLAFGRAAAHRSRVWRARLHDALLWRPPAASGGATSGGLATRVVSDLREVETYVMYGLGSLVIESATLVTILAVLAWTDAVATAGLFVLALPAILATRAIGRAVEAATRRHQDTIERLGARLQEHTRHRETLRAFDAFGFAARRFAPANREVEAAMAARVRWAALPAPVSQLLVFVAIGGLVAWLAQGVVAGRTTTGELVGFVTLVALLGTPAQLLPKALAMWQQARAAAFRLRALDEQRPAWSRRGDLVGPPEAGLRSDGLVVGFDAGPTLRADDVVIEGPGLVAVVGPSGTGKTSWLRTVLGLLPARAGRLRVAGVVVDEAGVADETALRARVAYVPQGSALLSGSLRDNLTLGRAIGDDALWAALRDVGLAATLSALPQGLDAPLAEDGQGLSGGQQQRLAIARALAGAPWVLLLDEPTSALDGAAEADLIDLLGRLASERLVVVVSHRRIVVEAADRVLVAGDGRLEERA